jgi:dTDP-4-amino-4,6-dideoxygalactose transaminase
VNAPIPMLDLKAQYAAIRQDIRAAIERVVESQQFILGPEVEALEHEVAAYCGTRFAIGVSSGTDALLVSLMALGIGPGDEVLTTPFSFIATATSIARLGAIPTFADIDPGTFNVDPAQIERRITRKTKAIIPVHLFGQMAEMHAIMEIAGRHGIPVVEDAAQAIGAERGGRRAGSIGALGCLSFFPSKNLGAFGDAGMVLTSDEGLAARARLLRAHGQESKHLASLVGGNFRLDAIQAAVLRVKLPHLDAWTEARRTRAAAYRELFSDMGLSAPIAKRRIKEAPVVLPHEAANVRHVYNQFVIRTAQRDVLRTFLDERGVASEIYYPRLTPMQACFACQRHRKTAFPEAERAANEVTALPIYPELLPSMQQSVVSAVASFSVGMRSHSVAMSHESS